MPVWPVMLYPLGQTFPHEHSSESFSGRNCCWKGTLNHRMHALPKGTARTSAQKGRGMLAFFFPGQVKPRKVVLLEDAPNPSLGLLFLEG